MPKNLCWKQSKRSMSNPSKCRICDSPHLEKILSLGEMPLTAAFVRREDLSRPEPAFPLNLAFCRCCGLVQLLETVAPDKIFGANYPYFSSFSPALLQHAKSHAANLIESRHLNSSSFVVELASNDGYLLKNFVERGIPVLGIDPPRDPLSRRRKPESRPSALFLTLAWRGSWRWPAGLI